MLLVPANGNCLYTSVMLSLLLPAMQTQSEFEKIIELLTGKENLVKLDLNGFKANYTNMYYLRYDPYFQNLIQKFLSYMGIEEKTWGGSNEIKTIANKLGVQIQEYCFPLNGSQELVESDLTLCGNLNASTTIRIFRGIASDKETLDEKDDFLLQKSKLNSLETSRHHRHYRLLYDKSLKLKSGSNEKEITLGIKTGNVLPLITITRSTASELIKIQRQEFYDSWWEYNKLHNKAYNTPFPEELFCRIMNAIVDFLGQRGVFQHYGTKEIIKMILVDGTITLN